MFDINTIYKFINEIFDNILFYTYGTFQVRQIAIGVLNSHSRLVATVLMAQMMGSENRRKGSDHTTRCET